MFKSTLKDTLGKTIEPVSFNSNTIDFNYSLGEFFNRLTSPIFFYRIHVSELLYNRLNWNNNKSKILNLPIQWPTYGEFAQKLGKWKWSDIYLESDHQGFFKEKMERGYILTDGSKLEKPKFDYAKANNYGQTAGNAWDIYYAEEKVIEKEEIKEKKEKITEFDLKDAHISFETYLRFERKQTFETWGGNVQVWDTGHLSNNVEMTEKLNDFDYLQTNFKQSRNYFIGTHKTSGDQAEGNPSHPYKACFGCLYHGSMGSITYVISILKVPAGNGGKFYSLTKRTQDGGTEKEYVLPDEEYYVVLNHNNYTIIQKTVIKTRQTVFSETKKTHTQEIDQSELEGKENENEVEIEKELNLNETEQEKSEQGLGNEKSLEKEKEQEKEMEKEGELEDLIEKAQEQEKEKENEKEDEGEKAEEKNKEQVKEQEQQEQEDEDEGENEGEDEDEGDEL